MSAIVQHPYFWIGVLVGWILYSVFESRREEKKRDKCYPNSAGIEATRKMLQSFCAGQLLPLEEAYPNCNDATELGRRAWEGCAYWLTNVYTSYSYLSTPMTAFFDMVDAYWGKSSGPAVKMHAFNEILNRSTNYYTIGGMPDDHNKIDKTPLYQLTRLVIDSYEDSVYKLK